MGVNFGGGDFGDSGRVINFVQASFLLRLDIAYYEKDYISYIFAERLSFDGASRSAGEVVGQSVTDATHLCLYNNLFAANP